MCLTFVHWSWLTIIIERLENIGTVSVIESDTTNHERCQPYWTWVLGGGGDGGVGTVDGAAADGSEDGCGSEATEACTSGVAEVGADGMLRHDDTWGWIGCAGFAIRSFFASKRNEAKPDPFCMRFASSRDFFSLHLASNFSLLTKLKFRQRFSLCFASSNLSFCFQFFRWNKINIFFRFVSLPIIFFSLPISSYHFKAKRNKRFFASFHFTITLWSKIKIGFQQH